jgi:RNA polymerase sigma-32 factor
MGTTAAQKKLFFNLRRLKGEMAALEEGDLRPEQVATIAHKLAVTEDEVISMNRRLGGGGDASLNAPIGGAGGDGESEWMDWLADDQTEGNQETRLADSEEFGARMSLLEEAMSELNERERHIISERRLKDEPATLEDLSKEYGVSRERVRQIEVRAFEKLQKAMKRRASERGLLAGADA